MSGEAGSGSVEPARDRVYAFVREGILRGRFPGASFVEEEQVCAALGVSRTPVREAFHRLEAERFIDLLPRRGALVRQVTAQELADLYETRRVIEGYAIARICQQRLPVPAKLAGILDRIDELDPADHFGHVELDRRFHFTMVSVLGNAVLSELYQSLGSRQQRVAMSALGADPERVTRIQQEHRALLAALQSGDEAQAQGVIEQHLRLVMNVVSRLPGFALTDTREGSF